MNRIATISNPTTNALPISIHQTNVENKIVNTFAARSLRHAAAFFAFAVLLALSHSSARAALTVEAWVGPSGALGVPATTTAMQFKVRNTNTYAVSGARMYTSLTTVGDVTSPMSSPFNLAPQEAKWINVIIPARGNLNTSLLGKQINGFAWVSGGAAFWVSFLNVLPSANLQVASVTVVSVHNGAKTFRLTIKNAGNAASQPQTVTVSTWLYADGQVGQAYTQTRSLPALQPGQSYTFSLTTQPSQGYEIRGSVTVGGKTTSITL